MVSLRTRLLGDYGRWPFFVGHSRKGPVVGVSRAIRIGPAVPSTQAGWSKTSLTGDPLRCAD